MQISVRAMCLLSWNPRCSPDRKTVRSQGHWEVGWLECSGVEAAWRSLQDFS